MKYTALIVAAGSGSRMGLGYNKMLYQFDNGKTILETTVDIFLNDQRCEQVVVVGSEQDIEQYQKLLINDRITFTIGGKNTTGIGISWIIKNNDAICFDT